MLNKTTLGVAISAALSFSASGAEQSIEKITVTANKFEQSINDVLASVNVIKRAEIEASNVRDLPSLLNTVVGLDIVSNGGFGQKADVFVRGASAKYTLVLVDGVRISDATSGSVSLTNIPVNSIERIEVIKGARAAIYGSDAIAGVINIITRDAINNTLSATFGSNSYSNYQLAGGVAKDALSFKYNAGYEETDGFDVTEKDPTAAITKDHDDDGYRNKNIGFNLSYHTEDLGQFSAQAQYSEGEGEYDSAYSSDAYDFENYIAKLGWEKSSQNYNQGVSVSLSQEENEQTGTAVNTFYSTERFEAEYRGLYTLTQTLELSGGVNLLQEDLSGSTATSLHEKRDNKALFIGAFYDDDIWLASAVIRTDDYDYHGRANTYSTGVGYKANKYISVRASHGTAFRAPSLVNAFVTNSLYYVGNSDIKPEEAVNNELGITLTTKWGRYDITIFDNNITNLIENQYDANLGKYVPSNVARVSMQGVEISAEFSALGFEHNANLSFLDTEDETTGKELARRPSEAFNYTLTKRWGHFDANLTMLYRSARDSISYYDTEIAAFTVFNIAANYQLLDNLALHARIENLTDKEYFTAGIGFAASGELLGYTAPSRQVFAGISYQF